MIEFIDFSTLLENKSLPAQQGANCGAKIEAEEHEQQNLVPAVAQKKCLAKPLQHYGRNWMIGCLNPCWAGSRPIRLGMWGANNNNNNNHEFGSTQSPSTWMRRNIVQVKPDNIHYNTSDNQQSPRCLATQLFESGDMIYWSWPIWSQSTHTTWGFTVIRSRKERNTPPLC